MPISNELMPLLMAQIYSANQRNKNTMAERERMSKKIGGNQRDAQTWGSVAQGVGTLANLGSLMGGSGMFDSADPMGPPAPQARPSGGWLDPNSYMGD